MSRGWRGAAALLLGLFVLSTSGHAASLRFCDRPLALNAAQKDKLFRLGGVIKAELEASGQTVALMSRSGLDLGRFGQRYSHAGFSLKNSPDTPWAIRQLYYACDEKRPRIFDQGVSGFLLGTEDPAIGYVSVVFMPAAESERLERAARDNRQALSLLGATYSANAYAFSLQYQNCNQWVAEMLAAAWGALPLDDSVRASAQRWLQDKGYVPSLIDVGDRILMGLASFMPWLHSDDHPSENLRQAHYRISMPASIESFIQQTVPGATRLEFCHTDQHIVIHRGWAPIAEGCVAGAGDTVVALD
ncbi:MAG: DUF2145 domain-containing protein [Rhizobacter sp.]|nr:DUF2145 domain-containing protein [Rhizobacter sp.]